MGCGWDAMDYRVSTDWTALPIHHHNWMHFSTWTSDVTDYVWAQLISWSGEAQSHYLFT